MPNNRSLEGEDDRSLLLCSNGLLFAIEGRPSASSLDSCPACWPMVDEYRS